MALDRQLQPIAAGRGNRCGQSGISVSSQRKTMLCANIAWVCNSIAVRNVMGITSSSETRSTIFHIHS